MLASDRMGEVFNLPTAKTCCTCMHLPCKGPMLYMIVCGTAIEQ